MVVSYPNQYRNYCVFSPLVNERIRQGESELPIIKESLSNPKSEDEVVEDLYILNCLLDEGVEGEKIVELSKTPLDDIPETVVYTLLP